MKQIRREIDGSQAVYICLCNALTDKKLQQAVATAGIQRPGEVYAACGCRAQCGQCVHVVLQLLRDHAHQINAKLLGAD